MAEGIHLYQTGAASIQPSWIWDAAKNTSLRPLELFTGRVFYRKASVLSTCAACYTPTAVPSMNNESPTGVFTRLGRDTSKGGD